MRFMVTAMMAIGLLVTWGKAGEPTLKISTSEVRKEVIVVIEGQLTAFRAGKVDQAYEFASQGLRQQASLAVFTQMVRIGYPEIWANERAEYGLVRDDGRRATTTARVHAKDGTTTTYDYVLVKDENVWRIAGVLRHEPRAEKT